MANYMGSARTNEFHVKDVDAFIEAATQMGVGVWVDDLATGRVSAYSMDPDEAGWPTHYCPEPSEDDTEDDTEDYLEPTEVDLAALVAPHLTENSVAIFFEVGAEKLRYLVGTALAVNAAGETRFLSLDDMFETAKELGSEVRFW